MNPGGARLARGHVVVALHEPTLGGASLSVLRAVPRLEELGWDFSFWVPHPSSASEELAAAGYDVGGAPRYIEYSGRSWRLPPGPRRRLASVPSYLAAYRRFLADRRPDLVHANSIICIAEALVAKRDGHRVLLHVHEMLPEALRGRAMRRVAWRYLDGIVAVSIASARRMALPGRLPRIAHEAAPIPDEPVKIRAHPEPFTVGTVAVISKRKGSDTFVDAAARLKERVPHIRFEMVGAPSDALEERWARRLLQRAESLEIDHTPHADVAERLRRWDAFVLPSRADPFPISMLEAMAAGLPVVGTRVDGIAEQLEGCGVTVPVSDPNALADAIASLAQASQPDREAMGAAARRRVMANFTIPRQAACLDEAYQAALARPHLSSARAAKGQPSEE